MNLLQDKLDVVQKKRSNLFQWRGQFTPQFVEYLLKQCSKTGDVALDPFSGSGTLLQEALLSQRSGIGFEINPAAYAMSEFFTWSQWSLEARWLFLNAFETKLNVVLKPLNGQKLFVEHPDYRTSYDALLQIGKQLIPVLESKERILWLNILALSEKEKKLPLRQGLQKSFAYLKDTLVRLPVAEQPLSAHWQDARSVGAIYPQHADLVLTSPPYINVFNYHQNYRAFVELFDLNILQIAQSEFGANRKNRTNRFKTVIQYCIDMEDTILSSWQALKPDGLLVMILGRQSNVNNSTFLNGQIISDIIHASNSFEPIEVQERTFSNKFGNDIKEDILIFRKTKASFQNRNAKNIAIQHLEHAIPVASAEMQLLLKDAIQAVDTVRMSPLFQTNPLFDENTTQR